MKNAVIIVCIFFFAGFHLFSQKVTYTSIVLTDSFPEENLPKGAVEVGFILDANGKPVAWGYQESETQYKAVAKLGDEFKDFKDGKDLTSYFRNDTITFWYREAFKDAQTFTYYSWDGKKLVYMDQEAMDPSQEAINDARAALRKGEIKEAAELYNTVKNPGGYYLEPVIAFNILGIAHFHAKDAYWAGNSKEAAGLMEDAFIYHMNKKLVSAETQDEFNSFIRANFVQDQIDSIGPWLSDYGLFLYTAGSLEKSIEFNAYLNICYPQMPDPYLNRGDALYDMKQEENAKDFYSKYIGILTAKGRENEIPTRVHDRMK